MWNRSTGYKYISQCSTDKARRIDNETNKRARKRKQKSKDRKARKQQRRENLRKVLLEAAYGGDDFFTISLEFVPREMEDEMRNKIQRNCQRFSLFDVSQL